MIERGGKRYYTISEVAGLAGVNLRTLRRWLAAGHLSHFLFPFRPGTKGPVYYRLEPPDEGDRLYPGEQVYVLPAEGGDRA